MNQQNVIIEKYPIDYYSYDSDVSRWSNKRLVKEIMNKGERSLAYRIYFLKLNGKEFLEINERNYEIESKIFRI